MERDDVEKLEALARAAGLARLSKTQLADYAQARKAATDYAARLPRDLSWTDEPALVLRLAPRAGGDTGDRT